MTGPMSFENMKKKDAIKIQEKQIPHTTQQNLSSKNVQLALKIETELDLKLYSTFSRN